MIKGNVNLQIPSPETLTREEKLKNVLRLQSLEALKIRDGFMDEDGCWTPGPYYWATTYTETFDEHWLAKGLNSPHQKFAKMGYLRWLMAQMMVRRRLFVPKSREMLVSWAAMAVATCVAMTRPRTRVLVQAQKLEKACELVRGTEPPGYCRTLWERQVSWCKERFPLAGRIEDMPADKMSFAGESSIQAVSAGADQVRQYHPTLFIMDEAAHMTEAEQSFGAALPVCPWIIVISSTAPGWFGDLSTR